MQNVSITTSSLAWLVIARICFSTAVAQEATFRFAPPDGSIATIKSRRETFDVQTDLGQTNKDVDDSLQEMRFNKLPQGYRIAESWLNVKTLVNGKPWTNPLLSVVLGTTNFSIVSDHGFLLSIENPREQLDKMKAILPPEERASAEKQFDPATVEEEQRLRWLQIYGVLEGRTFHQGDTFVTNFHSRGSLDSSAIYSIHSITNFNGKPVSVVRYFVSSDKADVESARTNNLMQGGLDPFFKLPVRALPNQRTAGERWIFYDTMLLMQEQSIENTLSPGRRRTQTIARTFETK